MDRFAQYLFISFIITRNVYSLLSFFSPIFLLKIEFPYPSKKKIYILGKLGRIWMKIFCQKKLTAQVRCLYSFYLISLGMIKPFNPFFFLMQNALLQFHLTHNLYNNRLHNEKYIIHA